MAMVQEPQRANRRGGALAVSPMAVQQAVAAVPKLVAAVQGLANGYGRLANKSLPQQQRLQKKGGRKQKTKGQGGNQASDPFTNTSKLSRGVTGGNSAIMRVTQQDVVALANQSPTALTANAASYVYPLGLATTLTGTNGTLSNAIPRLGTISALYRQFRILSLTFKFIPNQGYTASGSVAMGIDLSANAGVPSSFNNVIHHNPSVLFDVKAEKTITWNSNRAMKKDPRYCVAAGVADEDELSFGQFQLYSTNGNASGAALGILWISATLEFSGPC